MKSKLKPVLLMIVLMSSVSCVGSIEKIVSSDSSRSLVTVYLANYGWHTGLIIPKSSIPQELWPESEDFPDAQYLEAGWGDRDYYQAREPDLWMTLKAALLPTASVLYVKAVIMPSGQHYELVELKLSSDAFYHLCRYIHDSFDRAGFLRAAALDSAAYSGGRFYPAMRSFHLFRTCNAWTVSALRAAGIPMSIFSAMSASRLMSQARQFAGFGRCAGTDCNGLLMEPEPAN